MSLFTLLSKNKSSRQVEADRGVRARRTTTHGCQNCVRGSSILINRKDRNTKWQEDAPLSGRIFKESLQLQRNEKLSSFPLNCHHFKISSIFLPFFHFLYPKFLTTFLSHFLHFLHFNHSKRCTTAQPVSSEISCVIHALNLPVFTPLFHSCSSKFTTTTAQLPFYCRNCHKLHVKICPGLCTAVREHPWRVSSSNHPAL